jgi:hypothetical protein
LITQFFLDLAYAMADGLYGFLPAWEFSPDQEVLKKLGNGLSFWNSIAPIYELWQVMNITFLVGAAVFAFFAVNWVVRRICDVIP